jgi:UDP-glucose 4-epimerase
LVNVNDELKEVTDTDTDELKEVIDELKDIETDSLNEVILDDIDELTSVIDDETDDENDCVNELILVKESFVLAVFCTCKYLLLSIFALTNDNDLDFTILRYFSVYGPGQRPDMAIQKFLTAIKMGDELNITGDGTQKRDITYVEDVVDATISAISVDERKQIFNISGGKQFTLNQIIDECFKVTNLKSKVNYVDRPNGDQEETFGDISKAQKKLGFNPIFDIGTGLSNQFASLD